MDSGKKLEISRATASQEGKKISISPLQKQRQRYRKGSCALCSSRRPKIRTWLATSTSSLVKEMGSGLVRIALECARPTNRGKLFLETVWTMYCNGRKTSYSLKRVCSDLDRHILKLVQAISMGEGVLPMDEDGPDGELMNMRARFERVVGSKDSEAFYMMNPDGTRRSRVKHFPSKDLKWHYRAGWPLPACSSIQFIKFS